MLTRERNKQTFSANKTRKNVMMLSANLSLSALFSLVNKEDGVAYLTQYKVFSAKNFSPSIGEKFFVDNVLHFNIDTESTLVTIFCCNIALVHKVRQKQYCEGHKNKVLMSDLILPGTYYKQVPGTHKHHVFEYPIDGYFINLQVSAPPVEALQEVIDFLGQI